MKIKYLVLLIVISISSFAQDTPKYAYLKLHNFKGSLMIDMKADLSSFEKLFVEKIKDLGFQVIISNEEFYKIASNEYGKFTFWDIIYQQEVGRNPDVSIIVRDTVGSILYTKIEKQVMLTSQSNAYLKATEKIIKNIPTSFDSDKAGFKTLNENGNLRFIVGNSLFTNYVDKAISISTFRKKIKTENLEIECTINNFGIVSDVKVNANVSSSLTDEEKSQIAKPFYELPIWIPAYKEGKRVESNITYLKEWRTKN